MFSLFTSRQSILNRQCNEIWKFFKDDPTFQDAIDSDYAQLGIESLILTSNPPQIKGTTSNGSEFTCSPDTPTNPNTPTLPINCVCQNRTNQVNIKTNIFRDARELNRDFTTSIYDLAFPKVKEGSYNSIELVEDLQNKYWELQIESLKKKLTNDDLSMNDIITDIKAASDIYQGYSRIYFSNKDSAYRKLTRFIENYDLNLSFPEIDSIARYNGNIDFPLSQSPINQPGEGGAASTSELKSDP